ncbi:MAG TPA: hypothetical protein VGH60_01715 [Solirubrobacteraceae bacterium]
MRTVRPPAHRRLETWLWTGPLGHLLGGGLDLFRALASYALTRLRARSTAPRKK